MSGLSTVLDLAKSSDRVRRLLQRAAALALLSGVLKVVGLVCVAYAVGELLADDPSGAVVTRWAVGALAGLLGGFGARCLADIWRTRRVTSWRSSCAAASPTAWRTCRSARCRGSGPGASTRSSRTT
ncbi:hypothetical protein [Streptomyces sp.]|uniref:hypothetical protein n=1 Tax=Streptomyces sp. TaxID=1931 RepID=UPI0025D65D6D|nr:hypothetical protein [Streptomyces sp.]